MQTCFIAIAIATAVLPTLALAAPWGAQSSDCGIKHSFLVTGKRTAIVGEDCEILWEVAEQSRDGEVLENGNVLIAFKDGVKEFTKDKEVVFEYKLGGGNAEVSTASRLPGGNTLIAELGRNPRLLEVSADGEVVVEVPLQPETGNAHMQTRMARKMPNGNYLVPHLLAFAVKEYTPGGEVVRTIRTDLPELGGREGENWPFTAIHLENENVMVNLTHGNKTAVFDRQGELLWVAGNDDVDGRYADPCGGAYLSNGNIVACSYGQKKDEMADAFEINPFKQTVWEFKVAGFSGLHEIQILTTNGEPITSKR